MTLQKSIILVLAAAVLLVLNSCNASKKVQRRGGYVLVKNHVKSDNTYIDGDELEGLVQQKATRGRLSLLKPGVWIYESFSRGKQGNLKKKIREKYGTPPVILDTSMVARSEQNMLQYLANKGFYHARVSHQFSYKRATALVEYLLKTGSPSYIDRIDYSLPDNQIASYIYADSGNSYLHKGMIFDTYRLDEERDRITSYLRTQGYYDFSRSNITYLADTLSGNLKVAVQLQIRSLDTPADSTGQTKETVIPRYFIRNIYIMPDIEQAFISGKTYDTLTYSFRNTPRDSLEQLFYLLYGRKSRLRPSVFSNAITLRTGQAYNQSIVTQTYKRLIALPIVRSANISLNVVEQAGQGIQWLDCSVKLTRNPVNNLSIGTEGTNSAGSLGMGVNMLYQNRNIFRGAETFRLKVNTGAELQGSINTGDQDRKLWVFNALEAGIETGIDFPRLLLPFAIVRNQRSQQARTSIMAGFGFESRPDYSRNISTFSGSYHWSASPLIRHTLSPLEMNFVRIEKDSAFNAYLNGLTDPQFISQYNDHLLTMIRYSLVYSNQARMKEKRPFFLRINAETSGNVFYALDQVSNKRLTSEGYYKRFGVRYAQYMRTDIDFRKFWNIREDYSLAFRLMAGIGLPYGNSEGIPFEKSFWLGGANDMRGWKLRSLGPGSFSNDSVRFDRTGDMMGFASLEYRFPIYSFLNGALYTDAGNIWLRKYNPDFPGGKFELAQLGKQLAMDAGMGFRFDFSFFIFRIDWALRIKNPQQEAQWLNPEDFRFRSAIWNFGIGYPF